MYTLDRLEQIRQTKSRAKEQKLFTSVIESANQLVEKVPHFELPIPIIGQSAKKFTLNWKPTPSVKDEKR